MVQITPAFGSTNYWTPDSHAQNRPNGLEPCILHAPSVEVEAEVGMLAGVIIQSRDGPNHTSFWFN
jgi:hypothetical protein